MNALRYVARLTPSAAPQRSLVSIRYRGDQRDAMARGTEGDSAPDPPRIDGDPLSRPRVCGDADTGLCPAPGVVSYVDVGDVARVIRRLWSLLGGVWFSRHHLAMADGPIIDLNMLVLIHALGALVAAKGGKSRRLGTLVLSRRAWNTFCAEYAEYSPNGAPGGNRMVIDTAAGELLVCVEPDVAN